MFLKFVKKHEALEQVDQKDGGCPDPGVFPGELKFSTFVSQYE